MRQMQTTNEGLRNSQIYWLKKERFLRFENEQFNAHGTGIITPKCMAVVICFSLNNRDVHDSLLLLFLLLLINPLLPLLPLLHLLLLLIHLLFLLLPSFCICGQVSANNSIDLYHFSTLIYAEIVHMIPDILKLNKGECS